MENAMELDDLKLAWQSLDRRLERQRGPNLQLFRDSRVDRMKSGFRLAATGQIVQIIAGALICFFAAPFWIRHIDTLHLALYGLSLHAYGILFIAFAARDLYLMSQVDYSAPVLGIQKRLAELRSWRLRTGLWFAVTGCFSWVPFLLIIFYQFGADLWLHEPAVVYWCLTNSLVAVAAGWALVRLANRPGFEKLRKAIDESAAGRSLARAQTALDEIAGFEQD